MTLSICSVWIRRPPKVVSKTAVFNVSCFNMSESFAPRLFRQDNTLLTSHVFMYLGCESLRWKIPFINRGTNQCSPSLGTPGISTIALIVLQFVPIALCLSPNSYNVFKKLRTWLTVGWWGLSCRLLRKSSHRRTSVSYADCVLTLHDALMIWATSGDSPAVGRCLTKLWLPDWADPILGVVSLFLVAGAGVDVLVSTVVLSLVSPTAQIVGVTAVFVNRELSLRLSPDPVQVWPALFQLYYMGKDVGIKV